MTKSEIPSPRFELGLAPSEELSSRVRAAMETQPASLTSIAERRIMGLSAAACLTAVCLSFASMVVYHRQAVGLLVGALSTAHLLLILFLLVGLTLAATCVAMLRGRQGFGSGATSLLMVGTLAVPLYAILVLVNPVHAHDTSPGLVSISPWGIRCFGIALLVGTLVLTSFVLALRRSVPVASRFRGAALGAAAGTWAGLTVFAFCPSGDQWHILFGHVLPLVVLILLGVLVAPPTLRP